MANNRIPGLTPEEANKVVTYLNAQKNPAPANDKVRQRYCWSVFTPTRDVQKFEAGKCSVQYYAPMVLHLGRGKTTPFHHYFTVQKFRILITQLEANAEKSSEDSIMTTGDSYTVISRQTILNQLKREAEEYYKKQTEQKAQPPCQVFEVEKSTMQSVQTYYRDENLKLINFVEQQFGPQILKAVFGITVAEQKGAETQQREDFNFEVIEALWNIVKFRQNPPISSRNHNTEMIQLVSETTGTPRGVAKLIVEYNSGLETLEWKAANYREACLLYLQITGALTGKVNPEIILGFIEQPKGNTIVMTLGPLLAKENAAVGEEVATQEVTTEEVTFGRGRARRDT